KQKSIQCRPCVSCAYDGNIMPAEIVHRRERVREFFGNPSWSTFYDWLSKGLIPPPDVELGPSTPGWTDGLITRHQKERRLAAAPAAAPAAPPAPVSPGRPPPPSKQNAAW